MPRKIEITTLSTAAGTMQCDTRSTCPSVHALADRPAAYHLIGIPVTDPDELAAFAARMGPGEAVGR